jgi:hypothetical protein
MVLLRGGFDAQYSTDSRQITKEELANVTTKLRFSWHYSMMNAYNVLLHD